MPHGIINTPLCAYVCVIYDMWVTAPSSVIQIPHIMLQCGRNHVCAFLPHHEVPPRRPQELQQWPFYSIQGESQSVLCFSITVFFFLFSSSICDLDFFFLQGHAAPALYSMWVETGFLKESELLSLCQVDSALEGHLSPVSCHILYHTSRVFSCSTSSVPTVLTNILLRLFVVCNSEAATHWCSHWILGAGSWCGLWNGLYWKIFWQV